MKDTVHLKEINCSNCGGQIRFEPSTQLVVCNFCGSSFDIMKAESVQTESPDSIVPFKITKQQFQRLIFPWLIQGDYTPDDILFSATLQRIDGIYLPFYLVEGEYSGSWAASISPRNAAKVPPARGNEPQRPEGQEKRRFKWLYCP